MTAELALVDLPESIFEIPLGNIVRAGPDTVPATYTGIRVVCNDTVVRIFAHGLGRTNRYTPRINTMHTVTLDERETVNFTVFHLG